MSRKIAGPVPDERFHKLRAIGEQLGLSVRELYREVANGSLVVHRFNRAIRVAESDRQRYVAVRRCIPKK